MKQKSPGHLQCRASMRCVVGAFALSWCGESPDSQISVQSKLKPLIWWITSFLFLVFLLCCVRVPEDLFGAMCSFIMDHYAALNCSALASRGYNPKCHARSAHATVGTAARRFALKTLVELLRPHAPCPSLMQNAAISQRNTLKLMKCGRIWMSDRML